jgi:hypothetical protein
VCEESVSGTSARTHLPTRPPMLALVDDRWPGGQAGAGGQAPENTCLSKSMH